MVCKLDLMGERWRISGFLKSFMAFSWISSKFKVSTVAKWSKLVIILVACQFTSCCAFQTAHIFCFIHTFVVIVREGKKIKLFSEISHQTCHSKAAMSAPFIVLVHSSYSLFSCGRSQNVDSFWALGDIVIVELWNYFKLLLILFSSFCRII